MTEEIDLSPMEMINWIEEFRNNPNMKADLIPLSFYDFLTTTGMIETCDDMKWDYFRKAVLVIKSELNIAKSSCRTNNANIAYDEFENMERSKRWTPPIKERIRSKAKKLIVFDYLRKK